MHWCTVSYLSEPFKDNWLTFTDITDKQSLGVDYTTHLSNSFFEELKFDTDSLKEYRIDTARAAAKSLGDNPVLCLSGGIDSQAMIQCWQEAEIKFDTAILIFNDDLNSHDVSHARMFCQKNNITPIEININIIQYLTRESFAQAEKYQCSSPHFSTHYKMFDILRDMGYTGICCGGQAFAKDRTVWGPCLSAAQMNYVEYMRLNQYPVMGNFLGFDPKLCWSIAILTPKNDFEWNSSITNSLETAIQQRYSSKVAGYINHGFDILPQSSKFTGFEKVKTYFSNQTGEGWTFEKRFRYPLEQKFCSAFGRTLHIPETQLEILSRLHSEHRISRC